MLISRITLVIKCGMITIRIMYTRITAIIIDKKTLNDEIILPLADGFLIFLNNLSNVLSSKLHRGVRIYARIIPIMNGIIALIMCPIADFM